LKATRTSALAHFQTLPLKDATRQLHHAFQEIEIKPFTIYPSSFILFTMLANTLSNDPLSDKRFDRPFVNPPYGYEWSKEYDAVTTHKPMQNNPCVRQRLGQRGLKLETLPPLLPSSFSRFTFQRGQLCSSPQIPVCLGFLAENKREGKRRDRRKHTLFIDACKLGILIGAGRKQQSLN